MDVFRDKEISGIEQSEYVWQIVKTMHCHTDVARFSANYIKPRLWIRNAKKDVELSVI